MHVCVVDKRTPSQKKKSVVGKVINEANRIIRKTNCAIWTKSKQTLFSFSEGEKIKGCLNEYMRG
eukprot:m.11447 g.11447  ORF g.11447 m.11447 type:complete len:65 (+) comp6921_c0_seq1:172-366(+)